MKHSVRILCCLAGIAACVATSGCNKGHPGVTVSGTITRNGTPLTVPEKGKIVMSFSEIGDDGTLGVNSFPAVVNNDGTFEADIAAGKYRVAVHAYADGAKAEDTLGDKYSVQNSTLTREFTGSEDDVEIKVDDTAAAG